MEAEKRPQVRIKAASHKAASAAAATCKLSLAEYTEAALDYFSSRQLNPADEVAREGQLIMGQVKKLGDRVFSYLQVQEQTLLMPLLEELLRDRLTTERALRMSEILVSNLGRQLEQLTEAQLATQREGLKKLRQENRDLIEQQIQAAKAIAQQPDQGK